MPVYEYNCKKCDKSFEIWRSVDQKGAQKCPTCNGKTEKVFHAPGIIFKGSGFHVNDYGSKGNGNGSSKPKSAPSCPKAADKTCAGCESNS